MTTTDRRYRSDQVGLRLPNVEVVLRGAFPADVIRALGDLADPELFLGPDAATVELALTADDDHRLLTQVGGSGAAVPTVSTSDDDADLLDVLVGRLNRLVFDPGPGRLHLHGAALEIDGVGVLLAGASGSGKSTVAVELLRRGAAYLSDECVTVLPGSKAVYAYPKPIALKVGSIEHFSDMEVIARSAAHNGRAHVRAGDLGAVRPFTRPGVVVAVRFDPDAPPSMRPLSPAEACVRLLADSLDGIRLGPSALDVVGQLLAGATCWELIYRDAADAAELVGQLRPPLRAEPVVPARLPAASASGDSDRVSDPYRSDDSSVRVVRFDSSAALHDGASRLLLALDPDQVDGLEGRPSSAQGLRELADQLDRPVVAAPYVAAVDPLSFGLPGVASGGLDGAPPVEAGDLAAATRGRCTGVLVEQLRRGRASTGSDLAERARALHVAGQSTCALLERELPRLIELLDAAGARPVVLKGPVSAHDGPLPPHLRDFGDLDLLLPPDHMSAAVMALEAAGFERCFPQVSPEFDRRFVKSVTLRAPFSGDWGDRDAPTFEVDLHRTLTPGPFGEVLPLEELHAAAVPVQVHDRWYRALHPTHRFLHHCLHVVLGSSEPRLHSLRDLVLSAPRTPVGVDQVLTTAVTWGVTVVVQRAVDLSEARFPGSLPDDLVARIADASATRRQRLYLASYHRPGRSYSLPALATLAALPTWRDRIDMATMLVRHRRSRGVQDPLAE